MTVASCISADVRRTRERGTRRLFVSFFASSSHVNETTHLSPTNVIDRPWLIFSELLAREARDGVNSRPITPFRGISQSRGDCAPRGENIAQDAMATDSSMRLTSDSLIRHFEAAKNHAFHPALFDARANALGDFGGATESRGETSGFVSSSARGLERSDPSRLRSSDAASKPGTGRGLPLSLLSRLEPSGITVTKIPYVTFAMLFANRRSANEKR